MWVAFLALWFIDPFHRHIMYHLWYHRNVCSLGWASRAKPLAHARKRIRAFPVAAAFSDLNFECQALFSHIYIYMHGCMHGYINFRRWDVYCANLAIYLLVQYYGGMLFPQSWEAKVELGIPGNTWTRTPATNLTFPKIMSMSQNCEEILERSTKHNLTCLLIKNSWYQIHI